MHAKVKKVRARQILDSRGNPTVEVDLELASGHFGRASVPSGASVGSREALELRDLDNLVYNGNGVLKAVNNVNKAIASEIEGCEYLSQSELDCALNNLDGTKNKSVLGSNAILAVSIAFAKSVAAAGNIPLFKLIARLSGNNVQMPIPMLNIVNGGVHADNSLDIQEFMIIPKLETISSCLEAASSVFQNLKSLLKKRGYSTNVGDEGGFAPNFKSAIEALDAISESILKSGLEKQIDIALDIAASELFDSNYYCLKGENLKLTSQEFANYQQNLIDSYSIVSIEDSMAENDLIGWKLITDLIGHKAMLVGDDIFVTNEALLRSGIQKGLANALLVKMNQVGTLTETIDAVKLACANDYKTIVSHRSGETEDTTISHLAVGIGSKYIKAGSICRTDRVCKYNELLRISEIL